MNTALSIIPVEDIKNNFNDNLFFSFIDYMSVKDTTIKGYAVCLRHFINWKAAHNITQPQRQDIKTYKEYLNDKNFTAGTKAQYLRAVKHFFKWTASENLYPNVADHIKGAKVRHDNTKKDPLQERDIIKILDSINTETESGKRDYAMIILSVTGGLRIIELHRANIEDIKTIAGQKVLFIQGKGRDDKDEYKKLIPEVWKAINIYLNSRINVKKSDPLFNGIGNRAKGKRLTEPSISRIIKNILKNAGYDSDRLTAHSLRHTSITLLLKAGATIQEAQHHARHYDPATTGIYAHNIEREKDQSEQIIYNQIFNPQTKNMTDEAIKIFKNIPAEKQLEALELLKQFVL